MQNQLIGSHQPGAPALLENDTTITYGELADAVARTAAGLAAAGIGPGDRVAVLGDNDSSFVTGLLAAMAAGAAACPLSPLNPDEVTSSRLASLAPRALLASPSAAAAATAVRDAGLVEPALVATPAGTTSPDLPGLTADPLTAPVTVAPSDPAILLHTSGIVAAPRAAVLTHHNLTAAQDRMIAFGAGLHPATVAFAALSFAHVLGLNVVLLSHLRVGAALVLQARWDADESLALIERHGVTNLVAVPPMWSAWAERASSAATAMRSVTFARTGASTLHPDIAEAVHAGFGIELMQGYGLTETAGTVAIEPAARMNPGSVGRALPGVEMRLVEGGRPVEPGDRGEVWLRTPSVFQGYLDDPAATAEVLVSDGWCRTGDIGVQDDDGTLYLVGRSKDLINVSGFNVYPGEVEAALERHPAIRVALVVGEPHAVTGERVIAYVTGVEGVALDLAEVVDHCRNLLSRYKVPASIHVVDRLPFTAIGKRVRAQLR